MRKVLLFACALALNLPLVVSGQSGADLLKEFTKVLITDIPLSLVHVNDKTVPVLFQPPTLYSMRARAKDATMFYVQGTAERNVQMDTTNFTIEQNGETITSTSVNIRHFEKGKASIEKGQTVDGVLQFAKLVDISQPFTVRHGKDSVEFKFTSGQLKALQPEPPK